VAADLETQQRLLERARSGAPAERRAALEALLADFRGPALAAIHKTLASCGVDRRHAEEALQEAILKLLGGGLEAFRGLAAPRTYFVRIAVNAAIDLIRRLARSDPLEATGEPEASLLGAARPSAEEELAAAQLREALARCLELLPELYRRSVQLFYLDEVGDCATCAQAAACSRDAFMQQLSRARLRLADCLRRRLR